MPLFGGKSDPKKSRPGTDKNVSLSVPTNITDTQSGASATQVFSERFVATSTAEDRLNAVDDTVTKVNNLYKSGKALYTTNKDLIDGAWSAMAAATGAGRTIDDWIGPINKVLTGLEGLAKAQPFPFVELAVTLFNGVVQLELQRRQNSAKARALILQMADMMGSLLQLHFVEDPTLTTETGESVQGRIQNLMRDIEKDINTCGNLINKYHAHSLASKFFRSGQYAAQFKSAADGLVSRKGDITFACTIHTTVTVDEIRKQVRETNTMILKLTAIIEHQSDKEKAWEQTMTQYGGRKRVLESPDLTMQIAAQIEGRSVQDASLPGSKPTDAKTKPDAKAKDSKGAVTAKDEPTFNRRELLELQQPLEKILKDSLPYFENKLLAQVEIIKNQINRSTQQILHRLEAGSHEKIVHPDIRLVWKEMAWRSSVKAKIFVMGLHDYYLDRYAAAAAKANTVLTVTTTATLTVTIASPDASRPASPTADSVSSPFVQAMQLEEGAGCESKVTTDEAILADKEYLEYLTMPYVAAIIEAFDDDGSGFVRISEVNDFCAGIPSGWTLLQWIAYWARGWMVESALYSQNICGLLAGTYYRLGCTIVENHNIIFNYLYNRGWNDVVKSLTWCAAVKSVTKTDTPLDDLVKARMLQKEERLEKSLDGFNFVLDSPESLHLICDIGRIEKDMFAVIFVILRRHTRLIELAASKVMDEREFLDASSTLINVAQAIKQRVERLETNFQHQGLDADIEMSRYAGGVYEWLHKDEIPEDATEPDIPDEDWDPFWDDYILPASLDLKQFSKSDLWFDISAYKKPRRAALEDVAAVPAADTTATSAPVAKSSDLIKPYHSPLVVPEDHEIVELAAEHAADLREISAEAVKFIDLLTEKLSNKHPVQRILPFLSNIETEVHANETRDEIGERIFASVVHDLCAFAKLPNIDDENAPDGYHDTFTSRLREVLEPICIELALALRLYKVYREINAEPVKSEDTEEATEHGSTAGDPTEPHEGTPSGTKEKVVDPELTSIVERLSRHAPLLNAAIDVHTGSGITRFRAAAQLVLNEIHERHYRYSWAFLKRRRTLRKLFVTAYAIKMKFDDAYVLWELAHKGSADAEELYNTLSREVPNADRALWASLARFEYRQTIVHIARRCDNCANLIVGERYTCLYCDEFDLCYDCAQLRLRETKDWNGKLHHVWHPLIRLARPVVRIRKDFKDEFQTMFVRLYRDLDITGYIYESSSDSPSETSTDDDSDLSESVAADTDAGTDATGEHNEEEQDDNEVNDVTLRQDEDEEDDGDDKDAEEVAEEVEAKDDDDVVTSTLVSDGLQPDALVASVAPEAPTPSATTDGAVPESTVVARDFGENQSETAPEPAEAETPEATHQYECTECHKTKSGTRFITQHVFDAQQFCPECTKILTTPKDHNPIPSHLRILLRATLPLPDDDETTTVATNDEEETEQEKMAKQLHGVDERLETLEGRFDSMGERMQSLESKMDQILSLLTALQPQPQPRPPVPDAPATTAESTAPPTEAEAAS